MKVLKVIFILLMCSALYAETTDQELKNIKLIKEYESKINKVDFGEHMLISVLMGGFSGAVFGVGSGLIFYDSNDVDGTKNKLIVSGASLALVGAVVGGITSYYEYIDGTQFTLGKRVLDHTWYGGLGGGVVGALAGLIPYASSDNLDDIYNYTGYGVIGGLVVGWAMLFIDLPSNDLAMNFDFDFSREQFQFTFTNFLTKR